MIPLTVQIQTDGTVLLAGDLTFSTINKKTVQLIDVKKIAADLIIDFAQVTNTDSAGLALMIEWIKLSQAQQKPLKFRHIPSQLLTLAQLSGFDDNEYFASVS
jgi:phospholipid transport system transporter-binding protein